MRVNSLLRKDERGAIMVIALFFAIFAVGMLFITVGTARAALLRDNLQATADAAALSGAIFHARMMNLLVIVNVIMAALLAVLVALKLVETLAIIGIALATGLAYPTFGASLAAVPPLMIVQEKVKTAHDQLKSPIETSLEILHDIAGEMKDLAPSAALAVAQQELGAQGLTLRSGSVSAAKQLPVDDDEYSRLCGEAAKFPVDLGKKSLEPIKLGFILEPLSAAMESLATEFADWFCGSDDGSPPAYEQKEKIWVPASEDAAECLSSTPTLQQAARTATNATTPACSAASENANPAYPDESTGGCRRGADCSVDGPYERRAAEARRVCDPTETPHPLAYSYQQRKGRVDYTWMGNGWLRGEPKFEPPELVPESGAPPCGPRRVRPSVAEGYAAVVRTSRNVEDLNPVCSTERQPDVSVARFVNKGEVRTVAFQEVTHVLACQKETIVAAQVEAERSEGSTERSPKRIVPSVRLGDEQFQVRAVVQGDTSFGAAERMVSMSRSSEPKVAEAPPPFAAHSGFAFSEAEYFYDGAEGRDAWMWNMKWRGRLVRFRGTAEELVPLREGCVGLLNELIEGSTEGLVGARNCGALIDHLAQRAGQLAH